MQRLFNKPTPTRGRPGGAGSCLLPARCPRLPLLCACALRGLGRLWLLGAALCWYSGSPTLPWSRFSNIWVGSAVRRCRGGLRVRVHPGSEQHPWVHGVFRALKEHRLLGDTPLHRSDTPSFSDRTPLSSAWLRGHLGGCSCGIYMDLS